MVSKQPVIQIRCTNWKVCATNAFVHFCELAIVLGTSEKTIEISVATIMCTRRDLISEPSIHQYRFRPPYRFRKRDRIGFLRFRFFVFGFLGDSGSCTCFFSEHLLDLGVLPEYQKSVNCVFITRSPAKCCRLLNLKVNTFLLSHQSSDSPRCAAAECVRRKIGGSAHSSVCEQNRYLLFGFRKQKPDFPMGLPALGGDPVQDRFPLLFPELLPFSYGVLAPPWGFAIGRPVV